MWAVEIRAGLEIIKEMELVAEKINQEGLEEMVLKAWSGDQQRQPQAGTCTW